MGRYVSVDELKQQDFQDYSPEDVMTAIDNCPTADVKEVVHCRDCKWWEKYKGGLQGRCALHSISPTGSWYCANGVKMQK